MENPAKIYGSEYSVWDREMEQIMSVTKMTMLRWIKRIG